MISATDGVEWNYHGETGIYIADRLGSLTSKGISVPFFVFCGEKSIFEKYFGGLNYEKSRNSYGKRK